MTPDDIKPGMKVKYTGATLWLRPNPYGIVTELRQDSTDGWMVTIQTEVANPNNGWNKFTAFLWNIGPDDRNVQLDLSF